METYYFIDFENVHNAGIANIESMTKTDHLHIFYTQDAKNINITREKKGIEFHEVPVGNQSLDKHLVSYLGYRLGISGKDCRYVIISKDKGYDNIVKFWKERGYHNISRKEKMPGNVSTQKKIAQNTSQHQRNTRTVNGKIGAEAGYKFKGKDRSEAFLKSNCKVAERESEVRSFFGKHFKKKIYTDNKEEIIYIILNAKTKQQVKNGLVKLYSDGNVVIHIYTTMQPLIVDLPER